MTVEEIKAEAGRWTWQLQLPVRRRSSSSSSSLLARQVVATAVIRTCQAQGRETARMGMELNAQYSQRRQERRCVLRPAGCSCRGRGRGQRPRRPRRDDLLRSDPPALHDGSTAKMNRSAVLTTD